MKANAAIKTLKICKPCNPLSYPRKICFSVKPPKCSEKKKPSMIL